MQFLAVEGVTGQEEAIAEAVTDELKKVGVPASAIRFDDANKRIPLPTRDRQPDRRPARHAARPAAAVLHAPRHRAALRRREAEARRRPHRLRRHDGARRRQPHRLRRAGRRWPRRCSSTSCRTRRSRCCSPCARRAACTARANSTRRISAARRCASTSTASSPSELIIGAVGQENWEVEIKGKASHAGVAPEKGISATLVGVDRRLTEAQRGGWFGKVVKPERQRHQQRRHLRRQGRQAGRRRHQRRHRLCLHQGRGAQPGREFAAAIAEGYREAFAKAARR